MKRRSDGRYVKMVDGRSFYGTTEREVMRKIRDYKERKECGEAFSIVADEWESLEDDKSASSRFYNKPLERAKSYFGKTPVNEITASDVTRYLNHIARLGLAKKTVKNHKIVVSRILHYAVVEGLIPFNPCRDAEIPRNLPEKKRHPATPEEEFIISQNSDVWLLPYFALYTGLRKGECIGLMWKDIDFEKDIIHVCRSVTEEGVIKCPKTDAGKRDVPLLSSLKAELLKIKGKPNHYVFSGDKPLTPKAYQWRYRQFQKVTGIKATLHQLRKSFATMAVDAKVPPDVLRTIIGHADISTTLNIYAEVRNNRILEAKSSLENTNFVQNLGRPPKTP